MWATFRGPPIPDDQGGFVKDRQGNIVLSRVDEAGLKKLADMTGGAYVRSVAGDMDLDLIYKDRILEGMERKTLVAEKKKVWENRFQWFLFPAVILMLIEVMLSLKNGGRKVLRLVPVLLALGVLAHGTPAQARMVSTSVKKGVEAFEQKDFETAKNSFIEGQLKSPDDLRLYYNIGTAAYMNQEYDLAQKNFEKAMSSDDAALKHDARYNLANTLYRQDRLEDAVKMYEGLVQEFPDDQAAKENLEFVRQKLEEKKKQPPQESDDSQKNDQQQKKDGQDQKENQSNGQADDKNQEEKKSEQQDQKSDQPRDQQQSDQSQGNPQPDQQAGKQEDQQLENKQQQPADPSAGGQQDEKPPQPRPSQENNGEGAAASQANADFKNEPNPPGQGMDAMLNRLEDKPGQALMPAPGKVMIEKDW